MCIHRLLHDDKEVPGVSRAVCKDCSDTMGHTSCADGMSLRIAVTLSATATSKARTPEGDCGLGELQILSTGPTRTFGSSSASSTSTLTLGSIPRSSNTANSDGRRAKVTAKATITEGKPTGRPNTGDGDSRMTSVSTHPSAAKGGGIGFIQDGKSQIGAYCTPREALAKVRSPCG